MRKTLSRRDLLACYLLVRYLPVVIAAPDLANNASLAFYLAYAAGYPKDRNRSLSTRRNFWLRAPN